MLMSRIDPTIENVCPDCGNNTHMRWSNSSFGLTRFGQWGYIAPQCSRVLTIWFAEY